MKRQGGMLAGRLWSLIDARMHPKLVSPASSVRTLFLVIVFARAAKPFVEE